MAESKDRKITRAGRQSRDASLLGRRRAGQASGQEMHRLRRARITIRARSARSASATRPNGSKPRARATIYTYSVMRRAPVPYAIAYVDAGRGPDACMTNIVDCDLRCDQSRPAGEAWCSSRPTAARRCRCSRRRSGCRRAVPPRQDTVSPARQCALEARQLGLEMRAIVQQSARDQAQQRRCQRRILI